MYQNHGNKISFLRTFITTFELFKKYNQIDMKKLIAVIPVRAGSQRVKNKNFKPFAGKTLLEHKLDIVKQLPVDEIIINTDSELAVEMAKRHGVSYHIRESYYASSECSGSEFHEYLAKVTNSENILVAHVTEPLVSKETFIDGIKTYYNNDCDSLVSVEVVKKFLWYNGKPLNYNPEKVPASQDLPEYLSPTFGVVVAKRESILHSKHLICSKPYFYKINEIEAVDIDTELDFEFAEFLFNKYRRGINN